MRLYIARRLITVIVSALLLFVAAPILAQDTPAPSGTASPVPTPWPTVTSTAISFDSDQAVSLLGQPGMVRLIVNFTTIDLPEVTDYTRLALRTAEANAYEVIGSRLDDQPAEATPNVDRAGYSWFLPAANSPHELVVDLRVLKPIGPTAIALVVFNSDGSTAALSYLSEATVDQLVVAQQQLVTPTTTVVPPVDSPTAPTTAATTIIPLADTPTVLTVAATTDAALTAAPPPATATKPPPATLAPTITAAAPATPTAEPVVPLATSPPADGDDNSRLVLLLLGGLFLLAALAIGGLLLMRRRRPPVAPAAGARATARPVTVPLPPVGAETLTGVLVPVYLELEGDAPQVFPVNETPFTIGRDPDNSLPIDETIPGWQTVSREHALISRHDRGYVIEDLGSQNGVRVNGRLTPKNLLRNGWQVSVGGVTFRFVDETQTN